MLLIVTGLNNVWYQCPHFNRRAGDVDRISALEGGHKLIIDRLDNITHHDEEDRQYLKKHMEEEHVHHLKSNTAILTLTAVVNG